MSLLKNIKRGYRDVLHLFYPRFCLSCGQILHDQESYICHRCLSDLSFTHFHFGSSNPVYDRLSAIVKIENATALFLFNKSGIIQELIHQLKYNNQQIIGNFMAEVSRNYLNSDLLQKQIDYIIPVPLHSKKLKQRGYNQMTGFGKNLENYYSFQYSDKILIRQENTESQTKKSAAERRSNVRNAFKVLKPEKYSGRHFLLIDDVITTGATIEACADTLLKSIPGAKVSVLAMAVVL